MILGRYESFGTLGQGSLWELRAAHPVNEPSKTVVIKILGPDFAKTSAAKDFFEQETHYSSQLNHPYILRILETGIDEILGPCLVMEFVPGHSLDQVLRAKKTLPLDRFARLAGCLCHGLQAAHNKALIHRDLKPSNLMVVNYESPGESLKIMNFGLARLNNKPMIGRERNSGSGFYIAQRAGGYLSPEQIRGEDIDFRSDLYSVGVILYEALTGSHPFPLPTEELVLQAHLRQLPPRFQERNITNLPMSLESTILRCLAKFVSERPPSARDLANELSNSVGYDLWEAMSPPSFSVSQDGIPIAEAIPDTPPADPWHHVRQAEAWMPDQIAVLKIGGFLGDYQGKMLDSEPGLVKARFVINESPSGLIGRLFGNSKVESIDLEIQMVRPILTSNRILLTLNFRPTEGRIPSDRARYFLRCEYLFDEIRKYLM